MRSHLLALIAAMAMPFVRRKSSNDRETPYRSSRESAARSLRREDQSLMGQRWY